MSNPTFQHRHYAAIADLLAEAREKEGGTDTPWQAAFNDIEARFVELFQRDNFKFSEDRFVKAARRSYDMHGKDKVR